MGTPTSNELEINSALIDAIESFPLSRDVSHCGTVFTVPPLEIHATCPVCSSRIKVRSFSSGAEIEDVFDAVFAWLNKPGAQAVALQRQRQIADDPE
jgi:hypothetical protein